ncbi:MAG: pentapeptide repeat-containing protein [Candidatus Aquirickettsiella gammari]
MNAFDTALDQFHRNGCFIYQKACLNPEHITRIKASFEELDPNNTYQFHLSDVILDPQTNQVTPVRRRQSTRTSRSNSSSSSEGASGSSNGAISYRDIVWTERLEQFQQPVQAQAEAELTRSRYKFEKELLSVLKSRLAWSSIKIEGVYFQQGPERKHYLSARFHRPLLSHLMRLNSLTTLSLDPFFLSEGRVLLDNFLTGNMSLRYLSLGLTAGGTADWEKLGLNLAKHSRLIQANFGNTELVQANFENTVLNNANCSGLLTLAGNCYKTDIIFPELRLQDEIYLDMELREKYQALIERLRKTHEQRFIDERLSEASILDLVTNALSGLNPAQEITHSASLHDSAGPEAKLAEGAARVVGRLIDATVNEAQAADRSLERNPSTDSEKEQKARNLLAYLIRTENSPAILNSEVYRMLPQIYRDNWEYLENNLSPLKLNLNNPHPDKKQSIAYFLLNKVYESNDKKAFQLLMNPKVDVYGLTTGVQEGFFLKVSRDNNQDRLPLREILLEYVIQDNEAMGKIEESLKELYPTLIGCYQALNKHLKRYAKILHRRTDVTDSISQCIAKLKSIMVLVWKEDTAAKRPEEFAAIRGHFQESILSILVTKEEIRPSSDKFEAARAGLLAMIKISKKAEKGRVLKSNLHPGVLEISEATIEELWKIQNKLNNEYKGEADKYKAKYKTVAEEQAELKEKLSQTEVRCARKVSKITKEMQEERARVQAERARVQAERARVQEERARVQEEQDRLQAEQDRLQAERAEIEARVEARMQELERLFKARMGLPQNQAAASDSETAGTSYSFFPARR